MLPYETGEDNGLPSNTQGSGRWSVITKDPEATGDGYPGISGRHTVLQFDLDDGSFFEFPLVRGRGELFALALAQSEGFIKNP